MRFLALLAGLFVVGATPVAAEPVTSFKTFCIETVGAPETIHSMVATRGWAEQGVEESGLVVFQSPDGSESLSFGSYHDDLTGLYVDACMVVGVVDPGVAVSVLERTLGFAAAPADGFTVGWAATGRPGRFVNQPDLVNPADDIMAQSVKERGPITFVTIAEYENGSTALVRFTARP